MYYMQLGKLLSSAHARHTDIHTVRISHQKRFHKQIETWEYTVPLLCWTENPLQSLTEQRTPCRASVDPSHISAPLWIFVWSPLQHPLCANPPSVRQHEDKHPKNIPEHQEEVEVNYRHCADWGIAQVDGYSRRSARSAWWGASGRNKTAENIA